MTRAGPNPSISTTSVPYTCASGVTSHTPSTTGALGPGGEMLEEVSRESGATAHTAPEKSTTGPNPRPTAERQQPRLRPQSQGDPGGNWPLQGTWPRGASTQDNSPRPGPRERASHGPEGDTTNPSRDKQSCSSKSLSQKLLLPQRWGHFRTQQPLNINS